MTDLPARIAAVIAERRAYLTGFENIAVRHAVSAVPRTDGRPQCKHCHWAHPCPTLGYVAAALGIKP